MHLLPALDSPTSSLAATTGNNRAQPRKDAGASAAMTMNSKPELVAEAQAAEPNAPPGWSMAAPYKFPIDKLKRRTTHADFNPLVLVACGSFSPITMLHVQMFEMSAKYIEEHPQFEVVGNYLSPVSDSYTAKALTPAYHRLAMCELAVKDTDIMVDPWEASRRDEQGKPVYTRTADALAHFDHEINNVLGGIQAPDGTYKRARVALLIGADVAMTMGDPKVWAPADIDAIFEDFGVFIVERPAQADIEKVLVPLKKYKKVWVVPSFINDVSSTKVRAHLKNGHSVRDSVDELVIDYISNNGLYQGPGR